MSLVIVTPRQYILASKIHDITMTESHGTIEYRNTRGKLVGKIFKIFIIHLHYVPSNPNQNSSREEVRECSITISGLLNAQKIYQDLIRQIREQMPDELYLDKAFEHLLVVKDELEDADLKEAEESIYDRSAKKVRRARKAKRRSKKVLRRAKKRR